MPIIEPIFDEEPEIIQVIPTVPTFQDPIRLVPTVTKSFIPEQNQITPSPRRGQNPRKLLKKTGLAAVETPRTINEPVRGDFGSRRIRPTGQRARGQRPKNTQIPIVAQIPVEKTTERNILVLEPFDLEPLVEEPVFAPTTTRAPVVLTPQKLPRKFAAVKSQNPKQSSNRKQRVGIVDRYSVQNEDGSFTWGYQSADGSFKEETIGIDCVTRGR